MLKCSNVLGGSRVFSGLLDFEQVEVQVTFIFFEIPVESKSLAETMWEAALRGDAPPLAFPLVTGKRSREVVQQGILVIGYLNGFSGWFFF